MRKFAVVVLFLVVAAAAPVQAQVLPDIVYGHKDGMALTYDAFIADSPNGAGVIYMVSGGWYSRWREPSERIRQFQPLLDAGFAVFAVHHGSAPRFKVPDAVRDVRKATGYIRRHAGDYGIDPTRLGVWGGSAGGHLSLMLGLDPQAGAELAAVVAYYPPVDLRNRVGPSERFPALDFPVKTASAISPILFVSDEDPPVLLIHGDADDLVPLNDSEILAAEFDRVGVDYELLVIEGGDHGFRNPSHRAQATRAMVGWFEEYLGRPETAD